MMSLGYAPGYEDKELEEIEMVVAPLCMTIKQNRRHSSLPKGLA
jgi:hypothetical protein